MEVGCLKYPGASTIGSQPLDWNNAPMTGTTAQPSHEPPHQRKGNRHPSHWQKHQWRKNPTGLGEGRGKKIADRTQHEGKTERAKESHDRCKQPPGMRVFKTADLGTQTLLVVNSFKLHLTASSISHPNPQCNNKGQTTTPGTNAAVYWAKGGLDSSNRIMKWSLFGRGHKKMPVLDLTNSKVFVLLFRKVARVLEV